MKVEVGDFLPTNGRFLPEFIESAGYSLINTFTGISIKYEIWLSDIFLDMLEKSYGIGMVRTPDS